jgi:hypothetical protein
MGLRTCDLLHDVAIGIRMHSATELFDLGDT